MRDMADFSRIDASLCGSSQLTVLSTTYGRSWIGLGDPIRGVVSIRIQRKYIIRSIRKREKTEGLGF